VIDRTYVPNGNGSGQYFKDMKNDRFSADILGESLISNGLIILMAHHAFDTSGHSKEHLRAIGDEWKKLDTAHEDAHSANDYHKTQFERFQKYHNKKLKSLCDDGDTGKKHHALKISVIETRMMDLESKLARSSTKKI